MNIAAWCALHVKSGTQAKSRAVNSNNRWNGWGCATRWGVVGVPLQTLCSEQVPGSRAVRVNDGLYGNRCRR